MPQASQLLSENRHDAIALLNLTNETAHNFPALKAVAGSALYIIDAVKVSKFPLGSSAWPLYSLAQKFKSNTNEWSDLGQYIQNSTACIIQALPDAIEPQPDMKKKMENLHS